MLAGRPHETAGNGSPRWMTAASRKRAHRTRPTGGLPPFMLLTCGGAAVARPQFRHSSAGARRDPRSAALCPPGDPGFLRLREAAGRRVPRLISAADATRRAAALRAFGMPGKTP